MNLRTGFGIFAVASTLLLNGCGGGPIKLNLDLSGSGTFATIAVSPMPASVAAGAGQTFTATTTNAGGAPVTWSLGTTGASSPGAVGTLSATSGDTITYTAPSTPPIYSGTLLLETQGEVLLTATVTPTNGYLGASTVMQFIITAPTVSVGLSPATASVALGATEQFTGYAVGSINGALTWQVNGVTGGSTSTGTITEPGTYTNGGGLYTAPANMPMTGPTVTITMISQADPTKTQTAVVTLH